MTERSEPVAVAGWQARPIFVTSTFRDMHAERDWLRTRVFPELEERLRERFHHLEAVDLRWGVDSASADQEHDREVLVLRVCLQEIDRSRPFFIGMLGDRYGWRPSPKLLTEAIEEVGLSIPLTGTSVTEAEILYGVLDRLQQDGRSWFYLRTPLPYDTMPPDIAALYSDAHSDAVDAPENVSRLASLKKRLRVALPGRVRDYSVQWDSENHRVTGLDSWGAQVLEDLWSDLHAETMSFLREGPGTWQDQDRWALEQFIEGRVRNFVGRADVTNELMRVASAPAEVAGPWGVCVTGEEGSGKSSLFSHLYRSLRGTGVLILGHAAGISVRSTQVASMLRRWIGEVATVLGEGEPEVRNAPHDELRRVFQRLLWQAAARQRVVLLIDSLNDFESTAAGTHLTWLPEPWPPNARIIATTTQGQHSNAFTQRHRFTARLLPAVDGAEARDIAQSICVRHRRTINPRVMEALLAGGGEGKPAGRAPLWLELAVEELNLLSGDDFERAETQFPDVPSGADRIVALMVSTAQDMPSDLERLYGRLLDRVEALCGRAWTRGITYTIAASRTGWRQSDLESLMPRVTFEMWDDLKFALLRRNLRAHLAQRGAHTQWDFTHRSLRRAVEQRMAADGIDHAGLHARLAEHLLSLASDDPVHESETMVHLMSAGLTAAADYYGGRLTPAEADGACDVLATTILNGTSPSAEGHQSSLSAVVALLDHAPGLDERGQVAERLARDLRSRIEDKVPLATLKSLLAATQKAIADLAVAQPENPRWTLELGGSYSRLGDQLRAEGALVDALSAYQRSLHYAEQLAAREPNNGSVQHATALARVSIGLVLEQQGEPARALALYQQAARIEEGLLARDPAGSSYQHALGEYLHFIGRLMMAQGDSNGALSCFDRALTLRRELVEREPENTLWREALAQIHNDLGRALQTRDDVDRPIAAFREAVALLESLVAQDPDHGHWRRVLSESLADLSSVLATQRRTSEALEAVRRAVSLVEAAALLDPSTPQWQQPLSVLHERVGEILASDGDVNGAIAAYRQQLAILSRLVALDPSNASWRYDLSISHSKVGDMLEAQGSLDAAEAAYRQALQIKEQLAAKEPNHAGWQRGLALTYTRIGDVLRARGQLQAAHVTYSQALAIAERLVALDRSNAEWRRDLSVLQERIQTVLAQRDKPNISLARTSESSNRGSVDITVALSRVRPDRVIGSRESAEEYMATVSLGNAGLSDVVFDSVIIRMRPFALTDQQSPPLIDTIRLVVRRDRMRVQYSQSSQQPQPSEPETNVVVQDAFALPAGRGAELPAVPLGPSYFTKADVSLVEITISVMLGNQVVASPHCFALPAIEALSDYGSGALPVDAVTVEHLPTNTGIADVETCRMLFHTAAEFASDAVLLKVFPRQITTYHGPAGTPLHHAQDWLFQFMSAKRKCSFVVSPDDLGRVASSSLVDSTEAAVFGPSMASWLGCRVDARQAYLVGLQCGRSSGNQVEAQSSALSSPAKLGSPPLRLEVADLDGALTPLWILPLTYENVQLGVSAGAAHPFVLRDAQWQRLSRFWP